MQQISRKTNKRNKNVEQFETIINIFCAKKVEKENRSWEMKKKKIKIASH